MIAAQHLKELRLEKNYTQDHVALELGISQKTYSNMENGKTKIYLRQLYQLAEVFKMDIIELTKLLFQVDDNIIQEVKADHKGLTPDEIFNGVNSNLQMELLESYKERLDEQKEVIKLQEEKIKMLEDQLNAVKMA